MEPNLIKNNLPYVSNLNNYINYLILFLLLFFLLCIIIFCKNHKNKYIYNIHGTEQTKIN